jgi:hypothetical protein
MEPDPRESPFAFLTGGSFVLDSVRVFMWFKTLDDLLEHLRDNEPRAYDLEPGAGPSSRRAPIARSRSDLTGTPWRRN